MYVKNDKFEIIIRASSTEPRNYFVHVETTGGPTEQYACGPNNSIGNLVAKICNRLEIECFSDSE